jgi:Prohead core protein serine protease
MKLIKEYVEEVSLITEGTGSAKNYFIEGIFLQGGIANRNKRMYAMEVLRPEVTRYVKEYVEPKRAFGELGHPEGPTINLDRVSHMITSLKEDGKNFIGRAKVMDTPMGKIVKNLLDEGAKMGVSSRGLGTLVVNKEGINEVQSDFYLSTAADIVADPSAPDAFVQGIMENKEFWFDSARGTWVGIEAEKIQETIKKTQAKQLEEVKIRLFEKYLDSMTLRYKGDGSVDLFSR